MKTVLGLLITMVLSSLALAAHPGEEGDCAELITLRCKALDRRGKVTHEISFQKTSCPTETAVVVSASADLTERSSGTQLRFQDSLWQKVSLTSNVRESVGNVLGTQDRDEWGIQLRVAKKSKSGALSIWGETGLQAGSFAVECK